MTAELGVSFRSAMRGQASSVCIVAAQTPSGRRGMTATAVMSLSVDPPMLAIAINRSARLNPELMEGAPFSVQLLGERQADIAKAFSGAVSPDDRFSIGCWGQDNWGEPLLCDASANFSCVVERRLETPTHSLLCARVRDVRVAPQTRPLLYAHGEFAALRGLEQGCVA